MLRSPKAGAQDMTGKVCIVTGGSSDGVGRQTAAGLLAMGATVIISYRTGDAEAARQGVLAAARKWKWAAPQSAAAVDADAAADAMAARLVAWPLTLEDRVSVSRFANTARSAYPKGIDVLVNNAGAMLDLGDVENTKNGIEYHIDVNFLGPYQLTELLAPQLAKRRAQGGGRVVNVVHPGFGAARGARLIEDVYGRRFREDRPEPGFMQGRQIYAAKLGLVCQSLSLHQRGLPACVVYPGRVASQLRRLLAPSMCTTFYYPMVGLVMRTPYEGAQSVVHAAAMPTATFPSGSYMSNCTPRLNWKSRTVYDAAQRESILHWAGRQTSTPLVDLPRFS
jgi:NAD(P)-dependent dehydrogenase (short-subunit alcohol dehydrogenase family)